MIDLDALAATPLQQAPYDWALVDGAFDRERAPALIDTFPTRDFWQIAGHDGEKSYTYDARPLVICGADHAVELSPLSEPWQEVVDDLLSPGYREALSTAIRRPLDDAVMEANIWRWPNQAHLGPHLDMTEKIVTHVFYLNAGWNPWWGGCLRILNSKDEDDLASEIPPLLGNASILVRSDRSWHTVSPVGAAPVPRRSLIVTWLHAGSESQRGTRTPTAPFARSPSRRARSGMRHPCRRDSRRWKRTPPPPTLAARSSPPRALARSCEPRSRPRR